MIFLTVSAYDRRNLTETEIVMTLKNIGAAAAAAITLASPLLAGEEPVLFHETYGSGPEKVLVLHNWMGDLHSFDAARPWLDTAGFTYVFADVRGYGGSRDISGNYTSDEIAADTLRLADALGWDKFHLIGHSMNGMAGFKTVLGDWNGARRVKSYVAVTPATPDGYPATDEDRAFLLATVDQPEVAGMAFAALTGGKLGQRWSADMAADSAAVADRDAMRGYAAMWLDEDFSEAVQAAKIGTPVLVIGGRNDLPGFQQAYYDATIAQWLPNIDFQYIDNSGHYPMNETPVLFANIIETHMNTHK